MGIQELIGLFICITPLLLLGAYLVWASRRPNCPHCHYAVSPHAVDCRHCGQKIEPQLRDKSK
ncbi:hypothetical protein [Lignipirellula cremea]|uniref:Double zinc ribbon n=1 Tax=Lignipirellula cremea TaxID=2528010 RepID=A0A518DUH9_9BACT|nr:hypothetical protein [Lignipirellula cremea]QDU95493.1 hypothetical protein Pla8534_33080 [Lignipirellula cremea]